VLPSKSAWLRHERSAVQSCRDPSRPLPRGRRTLGSYAAARVTPGLIAKQWRETPHASRRDAVGLVDRDYEETASRCDLRSSNAASHSGRRLSRASQGGRSKPVGRLDRGLGRDGSLTISTPRWGVQPRVGRPFPCARGGARAGSRASFEKHFAVAPRRLRRASGLVEGAQQLRASPGSPIPPGEGKKHWRFCL